MKRSTRYFLLAGLLTALTPPAPAQQPVYADPALTPEQLQADVDLLRRALEHIHPGLTRYATQKQLDDAFAQLGRDCAGPLSGLAFYRSVSLTCATIRCGHTRVMAPRIDAYRAKHPTHLPFTFRIFGKALLVDKVAEGVQGLARGDEVISIEGRKIDELVDQIGETVCLDGFTDSARTSRLDTAYEFLDSGLDHYLPAWIGFHREFRLAVRRGTNKPRVIKVPAVTLAAWRELSPGPRDFSDATSWRRLDAKTALLTVDTFVNYRKPVDATARYRKLFGEIRDAKVEHLIVDLRNNGGGSTDASWPLARFVIAEPMTVSQPPIVRNYRCPDALRKHLSTWEKNAWKRPASLFKQVEGGYELSPFVAGPIKLKPHPDRFTGRVTVLTSRHNASGSTMLIACLQKLGGVRLVGEPTAGAPRGPTAGLLFTLQLPHSGLKINIPGMRVRTTVDGYPDGKGVEPDVRVTITRADFLAGRDRTLEAARR